MMKWCRDCGENTEHENGKCMIQHRPADKVQCHECLKISDWTIKDLGHGKQVKCDHCKKTLVYIAKELMQS